jgi:hypothetical protein
LQKSSLSKLISGSNPVPCFFGNALPVRGIGMLSTHPQYNRFLDYDDTADYEARLEEFRVALRKDK